MTTVRIAGTTYYVIGGRVPTPRVRFVADLPFGYPEARAALLTLAALAGVALGCWLSLRLPA